MGIFDIFTTDAQNAAAGDINSAVNRGLGGLNLGYGQGRDVLSGYGNAGLGALNQSYLGGSIPSLTGNYAAGLDALRGGVGQAANALNTNYASALAPFQQNYAEAQRGTGALGNALGLNGPQGSAAALQAFWASPAIQAQLDPNGPAMQNVLRSFQQSGRGASGGELTALNDYARNQAAGGWQNYVGNLQPYLGYSQGAASGIGNLYSGLGNQLSNLYGDVLGRGSANLYAGLGSQLAGQYSRLGDTQNATLGGLGSNLAQSYYTPGQAAYGGAMTAGNATANADLAGLNASGNIWGALAGAAGAGAGGAGMGGLGSRLFNMFR